MRLLRATLWGLLGLVVIGVVSWPLYFSSASETRGVWETEGYGLVVEVTPWRVKGYQRTAVSCLPFFSAPNHSLALHLAGGVGINAQDSSLRIDVDGTVNPIHTRPLDALPAACTDAPTPTRQHTADVFWHAMDEHYPFFDLHGVDWPARRDVLQASLSASSPDDSVLWDALTTALTGLDDGHIYLADPETGRVFSPATSPDWAGEVLDFRAVPRANSLVIVADTGVEYAVLPGNIGYIFLRHMGTDPAFGRTETEMAELGIELVVNDLAGTDAIIIDNRLNPGGTDGVALTYAGVFTDTPLPAFSKMTRTQDGFTAPFEAETPGTGGLSDKPVILLNSRFTASAAEIFTMALQEMPQVTVMGDPTSGGLSDILEFTLPNGWVLGLSHQVYRDAQGNEWEGIGIPPDIALPFDADAFRRGEDPQLQAALDRLR